MCRVKPPPSAAGSARILTPAIAVALVVGGCGTQQQEKVTVDPTVSLPTESVSAPPGVTLTEPGTELKVGETATVGFAPNAKRSTALRLRVRRINEGRISDLSRYGLNREAKASTPYYVKVGVANVGDGQIGRSAIPLWGLADDDTLIGASGFTTSFRKCPSGPLPRDFAKGASTRTCLMFLMPHGNKLVGVSYRPVMAEAPIVWKGTVVKPAQKKPQKRPQTKKPEEKASS